MSEAPAHSPAQPPAPASSPAPSLARRLVSDLITRKWLFWVAALVLCAADLWSKEWAQEEFQITALDMSGDEASDEVAIDKRLMEYREADPREIEWWPGVLHFKWAENKGAAFSIASGQSTFLLTIGVITLGFLLFFVFRLPSNARFSLLMLGFITGGAIGNMYDRAVFRAVDRRPVVDDEKNETFLQPVPAVRDFMYFPFDIPLYSTWGLDDAQLAAGHTRKWAIFNIADMGVTGGVIGLLLVTLVAPAPRKSDEDPIDGRSATSES